MEDKEYDRVVRLYLNPVYRVALSCCKNQYDAEDVVQNTFLKLLNSDTSFESDEHIHRWLIRVAVNESNTMWRSIWKRKVSSLDWVDLPEEFSSPEKSELFYAVQKLPPKYREVVHLYYYEEYSIKEIADILHIFQSAIQTRLMRARRKLKQQLKEAWL